MATTITAIRMFFLTMWMKIKGTECVMSHRHLMSHGLFIRAGAEKLFHTEFHLKRSTQFTPQKTRSTRSTEIEEMEESTIKSTPPTSFYLSVLEEQLRTEMNDSEARLTSSQTEGRVHLDIQEDLLADYIDEREQMQKTICQLKALLEEAEGKVTSSESHIKQLKDELTKTRKREQQTNNIQDLQSKCTFANDQKEASHTQEANKLIAALKEVEQQLKTERAQWEEDKLDLEADVATYKNRFLSQVKRHKEDRTKFETALKEAKDQLDSQHLQWQQEKTSLEEQLKKLKASSLTHLQEANTLPAALKEAEEQTKTARAQWEENKMELDVDVKIYKNRYLSQLKLHKEDRTKFQTALQEAKDQLDSQHLQWQQEKNSLEEQFNQALQEKEQQWVTTEQSMRAQLEGLENKLAKKKKKWYKKLIPMISNMK